MTGQQLLEVNSDPVTFGFKISEIPGEFTTPGSPCIQRVKNGQDSRKKAQTTIPHLHSIPSST